MAQAATTPATSFTTRREIGEVAEGYLEALISQGVDYLFLNPGTDTFPIQEAAAKLAALGRPAPKIILCLFEVVALAAAHGYYAATGRPQAVLVHVDVGTQNLGSMLHDAQRGRAAVVIAAGRAPYTTDPGERGSRSSYIHWLQEQLDQHGIVRNYVKWDYELRRPDQVGEVVARAFQIAASDPPGPTYLTLPREVLMHSTGEAELYQPQRFPPVQAGSGDAEALAEVARRLIASERPVVLTADTGRRAAGYQGLLQLAELLALPVVEWRNRANFPSDHPLHQGYDPAPFVAGSDLVLALDHDVPYYPSQVQPPADAFIVQIDRDPLKERIPLWTFPVDLPIRADTGKALEIIAEQAAALLTDADRRRIEARRANLAAHHTRQRDDWQAAAERDRDTSPMTVTWLGHCLRQLHAEAPDALFVDEMVTSNATVWQQLPVTQPESWYVSGGSGLGWGLGAAVGVRLANPDRPVIALVGDGSFVFGAPLAALWAAQVNGAPFLCVIFNNTCYNATLRPLVAAYPEGYSVRSGDVIGVNLTPPPRYAMLAEAVGGYGEQVDDPTELLPALRRGLEQVRQDRTAIIDVMLAHPQ